MAGCVLRNLERTDDRDLVTPGRHLSAQETLLLRLDNEKGGRLQFQGQLVQKMLEGGTAEECWTRSFGLDSVSERKSRWNCRGDRVTCTLHVARMSNSGFRICEV